MTKGLESSAQLGPRGEELARTFLKKQGFRLAATDYRVGRWQADILAWEGRIPVVVEVKSGRRRPEARLLPAQVERLVQLGRIFFPERAGPGSSRA